MPRRFIDRLLLPAIFGLTTMLAVLILWQMLLGHRNVEIQAATRDQALFVQTKTESELKARVVSLERLAARWKIDGRSTETDMESDAALVMSGYPAYQAIEWADSSFRPLWSVPAEHTRVPGAQSASAPVLQNILQKASPTNTTVVVPNVQLPNDRLGFLVCVPVRSTKLNGFLVGLFQDKELLSSILGGVAQDYWVTVYDGNTPIYDRGPTNPPSNDRYAEQANISLGSLSWRTVAWPKAGAVSYARSALPVLVSIGGILMSLTLAFAVFMAESAQLNVRKLAKANLELEKEIAGREQAEEALRHAQKMEAIGRLAGGVAHDFNNLLMVIRGQATLSQNGAGLSSTVRRELAEIVRAADRASSLTRKLLALGRRQVLQSRVLDLNSLVGQVAEILPPVLGADISICMDLTPELGHVRADAAQFEQVIMNLVFNARDAMSHGGKLSIRTANAALDYDAVRTHPGIQAGRYVVLAVGDTGHGMDEQTQSHLFEPFFTTKETGKGTGLGLATVYGTVDQSGGFITVSSKIGVGTIFEIYLPRVDEPVEAVEAPRPVSLPVGGSERILVVEDDDAVRRMTREFLTINGYEVVEVRSAVEAIRCMESQGDTIDLVLTDVVMPGMKGGELVERLSQHHANLKVLYMSAYTEGDAINFGMLSPGMAFIEKPFSPDELAGKIRAVLTGNGTGPSLHTKAQA
ncbi:MAG TPA: response regulator [Candidatus Acidoferrales bacterium]|nr:response regulator [Candidatus Acidoferrales bacterium]